MSEHIQQAPNVADSLGELEHGHGATDSFKTPGVSSEGEWFNFWMIFKVGVGLAAIIGAVLLINWQLLHGLEDINEPPAGSVSTMAHKDAQRTLGQRLQSVSGPLLEGAEPESSLLVLRVRDEEGNSVDRRFFVAPNIQVQIDDRKGARLFELYEGQRVAIAYYVPSGRQDDIGIVNTATNPPPQTSESKGEREAELSQRDATRTQKLTGVLVKLEPRGIAAARQWADVRLNRNGWTDRRQNIVHVPIEQAMKKVLDSPEFRSKDGKKKGDGRTMSPTRSSSGRAPEGGKP